MGKGMGHCLCAAYEYLDRIVPRFGFYEHQNEYKDMKRIWLIFSDVKYMIWWSMNVHSVLECWYERIAHIGTPIDLCIDIWTCVTFMCYVKGLLTYKFTHMYDDLFNRGAFERCAQYYPKIYKCIHMLFPCERVSHVI